jgi:two-component system sensor histidine kinase KdpD
MDVLHESTDVNELIAAAVGSLGPRGTEVTVEIPASLPRVRTDPVLLERAVANLVDNSLIHARGRGLRVEAGPVAGRVDIRVIDRGPGIRREDRDLVFRPFQRLGDSENRVGVGLGLAVARGFVEAVGAELDIEDTPGGGCTMVIRIPVTGQVDESSPVPATELSPASPDDVGTASATKDGSRAGSPP